MTFKTVDSHTLKQWLSNDEAVVIDVREPVEHEAQRIARAHLVPLSTVTHGVLPHFEGKKLVMQCRSGGRSGNACRKLLEENPELDIYNLEGGILAWAQAGLPVQEPVLEMAAGASVAPRKCMPLEQQVQLTIGLGVLVGSILTYFVHPIFFGIPAFFGAGLIFAALTGTCTLMTILGNMPWNRVAGVQKTGGGCCSTKTGCGCS